MISPTWLPTMVISQTIRPSIIHFAASAFFQRVSSVTSVQSGSATNRQLAELLCDPIRDSIEFLITLTVWLVEECLL